MQSFVRRRLVKMFDGVYILNKPSTNASLIYTPNLSCQKMKVYKSTINDRIGFVYLEKSKKLI
jgi:hypothetical protein